MKRVIPLLLALLLLGGCGAAPAGYSPVEPPVPREAADVPVLPDTLPETGPAEPISAPAAVTSGREPAEGYDLPPSQAEQDYQENLVRCAYGGAIGLLAEAPEADAAFYGLPLAKSALVRWGDSLAEFSWLFATSRLYLPELYCFDFDGDGQEELVVLCYSDSGTGVSIYDLHVVEKNPDGTLTDYALPEKLFDLLSERISICSLEERTYAVLGTELLDLTGFFTGEVTDVQGLAAGDIVYYDVNPKRIPQQPVRFRGSAWAESDYFPATGMYMADLEARVSYGDGVFTLSDIHLNSNA